MSRYAYPAIFTPEKEGGYSITFPDLEGCYTCGDNLAYSLMMAEDALALILYGYETDGRTIPEWLNEAASEAGVNFSQVLQDALKARLNLG